MTAALEGGEWSAARPGRTLPPGKDPVPILQEAGRAPGPVWTGGKSRPHRDSIPDRPARSSVAIPTELPGPRKVKYLVCIKQCQSVGTAVSTDGHSCRLTMVPLIVSHRVCAVRATRTV